MAKTQTLTRAMRDELRCIEKHGTFRELDDYGLGALAFYARDRVLGALLRRGLIESAPNDYAITDAGREALKG